MTRAGRPVCKGKEIDASAAERRNLISPTRQRWERTPFRSSEPRSGDIRRGRDVAAPRLTNRDDRIPTADRRGLLIFRRSAALCDDFFTACEPASVAKERASRSQP